VIGDVTIAVAFKEVQNGAHFTSTIGSSKSLNINIEEDGDEELRRNSSGRGSLGNNLFSKGPLQNVTPVIQVTESCKTEPDFPVIKSVRRRTNSVHDLGGLDLDAIKLNFPVMRGPAESSDSDGNEDAALPRNLH